jgi:hypothetical protein
MNIGFNMLRKKKVHRILWSSFLDQASKNIKTSGGKYNEMGNTSL